MTSVIAAYSEEVPVTTARELWLRYEPIHDLVYFGPRRTEQADALGLRGFWMGYFAFRAAPLGAVPPEVVAATFFGFHPSRVRRALPDAWSYTTVEQAIAAREATVDAALADLGPLETLDEAAELAWQAAAAAETAGRPLAAANQALPRSDNPRIALWQATSTLREHRGDGHVAVLVARGIGPAEAHLLKSGAGESDEQTLKVHRGFPEDEWAAARAGLVDRGLLDPAGRLTAAGAAEHEAVEAATDAAAEQPWEAIGPVATARLSTLLDPITTAVLGAALIPYPNPVGMPHPA
jgi:Helix-turn-helix family